MKHSGSSYKYWKTPLNYLFPPPQPLGQVFDVEQPSINFREITAQSGHIAATPGKGG